MMGSDPQESSPLSISLFVVAILISHLLGPSLEENRWINGSMVSQYMGLGIGVVRLLTHQASTLLIKFNEQLFFYYVLPPIIFNAGFQVRKKQFFRNFPTITLFGVIGTLISFGIISSGALRLFKIMDVGFSHLSDYLAIGAIFAATDSVSTLQVLNQEATPFVYSLVFGESVVNDATSVVLFNVIKRFEPTGIGAKVVLQFVLEASYLFIASKSLGVSIGLLCAYMTKKLHFDGESSRCEIAIMILMAYLSYLLAELFYLSGILSVFFCGITMSHYTWHNVTENSRITTKHIFATMSSIAETFIYVYVGMDALVMQRWTGVLHSVGTSVGVSATLLGLALVGRAASIFLLSFLSNLMKKAPDEKIGVKQQVTIWWAGLIRGSVSMALANNQFVRSSHSQESGNLIMITSTIIVILFSSQVWPPRGLKKFESLLKEINYLLLKGWVPCIEFEVGPAFVYRENNKSPGYYDGRYWTMWKLPMFGCTDGAQVAAEVEEAKKAYPDAHIRIIGFDNKRQVQCISFIAYKPT